MSLQVKNTIIQNLTQEQASLVDAGYLGTITAFAIIGSIICNKIRRKLFLSWWMTLGVVASLLLMLSQNVSFEGVFAMFFFLGAVFGVGMPSCLASFADSIAIENRGRIGGLIFFTVSVSLIPLGMLFEIHNLASNAAILAVWRLFGLIAFLLSSPKEEISVVEKPSHVRFISIFQSRMFILYFIPWFIFSLLDSFEGTIIENFLDPGLYSTTITVGVATSALFVLIAGVLADRIGRKKVVIYGFIALGLAYALVGIAPTITLSWYLFSIIDGVIAGLFMVTFVLLLWGDQAPLGFREKYYAIGNIPYFAASIIRIATIPYVVLIPAFASFSLASFFLFLAVLPLMYAPETLPEKKIELRRLKKYVEEARKVKEKRE